MVKNTRIAIQFDHVIVCFAPFTFLMLERETRENITEIAAFKLGLCISKHKIVHICVDLKLALDKNLSPLYSSSKFFR